LPSRPAEQVPAVDTIRALATLAVVLYHSWLISGSAKLDDGALRAVVSSGWMGVDVFFILSGFVHFLPVVKRGTVGPWRQYARRRIARLVPVYYLCLLVVIYLTKAVDWWALAVHAVFLQIPVFGLTVRTGMNADQPVWTLSIEAIFYVLLVFVASWFVRQPWIGVAIGLVVAVAWKLATRRHGVNWAVQFPSFAFHFAVGMALAVVFIKHRERIARWSTIGIVVSLLAFVLAARPLVDSDAVRHFTENLPFAAAMAAFVLFTVTSRWSFSAAPIRFFSSISYGVYLFHILVIGRVLRFTHPDGSTAAFLKTAGLTLPISIAIGYASLKLVETPLRRRVAAAPRTS
jgi:peptidoglycan/LPS O-acetylase OafA/YrhL